MKRHTIGSRRVLGLLLLLIGPLVATAALAGETSLTMNSAAGDYIGQGQNYAYTDQNADFTATFNTFFNNADHVQIDVNDPGFSFWWTLDFGPMHNAQLVVTTYNGCTRWPFNAVDEPGLSVTGNGRGCNNLTGTYTVHEINIDVMGNVVAFRATFEQHCEGALPALFGEIKYNATATNPVEASTWGSIKALYTE